MVTSRACDPAKPFGTPQAVTSLNTTSDDGYAVFSPDLLTVYFASKRPGGSGDYDLYSATRTSATGAFGTPVPVGVNSAQAEVQPVLSPDGLTMYFATARDGTRDVYVATRTSTAAAFGTPGKLLNVNTTQYDEEPSFLNASQTELYVSQYNADGWEILVATRPTTSDVFGVMNQVGSLNGSAQDYGPQFTSDMLTAVFHSTRNSALGDIFSATRQAATSAFGTPTELSTLNSAATEWVSWMSADGCTVAITSNRPDSLTGYDIYLATRPL
jgi:Tol biopolymer transport system component